MVSLGNMHTINIIQTEQLVFMLTQTYTHKYTHAQLWIGRGCECERAKEIRNILESFRKEGKERRGNIGKNCHCCLFYSAYDQCRANKINSVYLYACYRGNNENYNFIGYPDYKIIVQELFDYNQRVGIAQIK